MNRPRLDLMLPVVAELCGTSVQSLTGSTRNHHVYESRLIYTQVAKLYGYRHYEIGWALNKTKGAINYYVNRAQDLLLADSNFKRKLGITFQKIQSWYTETNMNI